MCLEMGMKVSDVQLVGSRKTDQFQMLYVNMIFPPFMWSTITQGCQT